MDLAPKIIVPTDNEYQILADIVEQTRPLMVPGSACEALGKAECLGAHCEGPLARIVSGIRGLLTHEGSSNIVVVDLRTLFREKMTILPPTPLEFPGRSEHLLTPVDVARCAIIGAAGGFSYCYSDQANGALCDDVMPLKRFANTPGFSAGTEVGWHTEDAPFNRSNDDSLHTTYDVLSFCYLRNPNGDPTLATVPDFSQMDTRLLQELQKFQFVTKTSIAQGHDKNSIVRTTSLIYGAGKMRFSFARLAEQREKGEYDSRLLEIIDEFIAYLNRFRVEVPSTPGTLAFIDNMRVAHARAPWRQSPNFDGNDRWQRRLGCAFASRRKLLERLMPEPDLRMIDNSLLMSYLQDLS